MAENQALRDNRYSKTNPPPASRNHPNRGPYLGALLKKFLKKTIKYEDPETQKIIKGRVKTLTIIKTPTNKWFACFSVQQDISPVKRSSNKIVGVDLGLEKFATLSDGTVIENPRWLKKSLELLKSIEENA